MKKIMSAVMVASLALAGAVSTSGIANAAPAASTLIMSGGNGVYDLGPVVINGTASALGTVEFIVNGKVVTGCEAVATASIAPYVAKCSWVPAKSGATVITGNFTPNDATNFAPAVSNTLNVNIGVPVQGVVSPIHIYVDTVLASGTSGPLAPRFGVSCAIQSEYIVGQGIVFRVYANNADHGGAVMDTTNTAKAYIEVSGVKDPIQMSYGNHSGAAFWTGVLRTGTNPGQYNTLGVINYKVTMVAKDSSTMKVLSTKLILKKVDGVKVLGADGRPVYERVSYYRTVKLSVPLKGAVGTWKSNFMPASQLTLFALPKA
jgi:hypothetical protein